MGGTSVRTPPLSVSLCKPDPARAGHRRGDSGWEAAGGDDGGGTDGAFSCRVAGAGRGGIPPAIAAKRRRPCYRCSEIQR